MRALLRDTGLLTVIALLKGVAALAAGVVLVRVLGPSARGKYTFVVTTASLLAWFVSYGMGSTLTRAKALGGKSIAELYAASLRASAVTGALVAGLWVLAFFSLRDGAMSGVNASDAWWVAFLIPTLVLTNNLGHVAMLEGRAVLFNALGSVASVVFLGSLLALTAGDRLTTSRAIATWAAAAALPVLLFRRRHGRVDGDHWRTVAKLVARSMHANLASIAVFGMWRIDVLFVKAQRGYRELGLYAVAVSVAEILLLATISARIVLVARQGDSDRRELLPPLLAQVTRLTTLVGVVGGIVICALGSPIITLLYGDEVVSAAPALTLLMPGIIALALHGPLFDYLYSEGRANGVIAIMGLALLLNVVLNMILLRTHTFLASAFASTVSYVVVLGACAVQFRRVTGLPVLSLLCPRGDDIKAVLGGIRSRRQTTGDSRQ